MSDYTNYTREEILFKLQSLYDNKIELEKFVDDNLNDKLFYLYLLKSMKAAIIATDITGKIIFVNPSAEYLYGWNSEEILQKSIFDFIPALSSKSIANDILSDLKKSKEWSGELLARKKDGSEFMAYVVNTPVINKKGDLIAFIGISTDISNIRKIKDDLRDKTANVKYFAKLIEEVSEAIISTDVDLNIISWNKGAEKIYGYLWEEVKGKNLREITRSEELEGKKWKDIYDKLFRNNYWSGEVVQYSKNGDKKIVLVSIFVISDNFDSKYVVSVNRDITEKVEILNNFKISEEHYRELINNIPSGVAVYEAIDSGDNFIFKDFNKSGELIDNITKEKVIGKKVTDVFPGIDKFGLFDVFKSVYKDGMSRYHPVSLYEDNRTLGWRDNYVYKLSTGEIVAVYNDITNRKRLEFREKMYSDILELLNSMENFKKLIDLILEKIKNFTGIEAIGIRLKEGNEFPYYATKGFTEEFIENENSLCVLKKDNETVIEYSGSSYLEDIYSKILTGKMEKGMECFTDGGSFYTYDSKALLKDKYGVDFIFDKKNDCSIECYDSVALIPIRAQDEIIGLLQFSDHRKHCLNLDTIYFFEKVGSTIGIAFSRLKDQEKLLYSLEEKETLLRELYHRTKNNMQVICSILALQADKIEDEETLKRFKETENRIHSMALVHSKLYQSSSLSNIDLREYVIDLTNLLIASYKISPEDITFKFKLDPVFVLIDVAMPVGLVLNELISNIFIHAFPGNKKGEVFISLNKKDNKVFMEVFDNGVGFSENFNAETDNKLGLQLVSNLVEIQLGGKLKIINDDGIKCRFEFIDDIYKERI